jgi:ribosomal-protein-alanine N-acetyltransferase
VATHAFNPPTLPVGDYVLRPFRSEDAAAWFEYLADPRVTEHTSWPPITREFVTAVVDKVMQDYADLQSLRWAFAGCEDNVLVGSCGYTRWLRKEAKAELAYDLAPSHWRRGLMSSAVRAVVEWAFQFGSLRRVEAFVMTTNEPSIAVLERTGFRREHRLAGHRLARGALRDFYLYSVESRAG